MKHYPNGWTELSKDEMILKDIANKCSISWALLFRLMMRYISKTRVVYLSMCQNYTRCIYR
jgi:hypothetical protein